MEADRDASSDPHIARDVNYRRQESMINICKTMISSLSFDIDW
jgi:hypothetical protein